jgi:hypothetical protein
MKNASPEILRTKFKRTCCCHKATSLPQNTSTNVPPGKQPLSCSTPVSDINSRQNYFKSEQQFTFHKPGLGWKTKEFPLKNFLRICSVGKLLSKLQSLKVHRFGVLCRLVNGIKLEYLDVTVLRCGVGEVRVVAGRAPTFWQVWRGMQYKEECFISELETSARTESKRMTNHNTPQLSRTDLANHCAAFPGLSLVNTGAEL